MGALGKSSIEEIDKIRCEDGVVICVDFEHKLSDYIFLGNLRRYRELPKDKYQDVLWLQILTALDSVYMQNTDLVL